MEERESPLATLGKAGVSITLPTSGAISGWSSEAPKEGPDAAQGGQRGGLRGQEGQAMRFKVTVQALRPSAPCSSPSVASPAPQDHLPDPAP